MGYSKETIKGLGWMGGLRGSVRIVSFIRIGILARLLTPFQFGLFGIASLVLEFLEVITETGINVFLIQEKKDIKEYVNTAWVVSIIRGILISILILFLAPYISVFFKSPESLLYLRLIAIVPFIRGFINPAEARFQKELQFNKEFYFRSILFFIDSLFAIIFTLITNTAVGIILGVIIGAFCEVVFSHLWITPKPKLKFESEKIKKVVHKGKYVTASGFFNYLAQEGDDWVVGRLLGNTNLGLYQAAYKISSLPLTEITQIAGKVTFPVYTKIASDKKRLWNAFKKTSLGLLSIIVPFGIMMFIFPEFIIRVILGPQWLGAASVLKVLAIFGIIRASIGLAHSLFLSLNKQQYVATITFVQFITLAIFIVPGIRMFGLVGAGYATIIAVIVPLPLVLYYLSNIFKNEK